MGKLFKSQVFAAASAVQSAQRNPFLREPGSPRKVTPIRQPVQVNHFSEEALGKHFDEQIQKLEHLGFSAQALALLHCQKAQVIEEAAQIQFGSLDYPIVPVLPPPYAGFYELVSKVRLGEKVCATCLDPGAIRQLVHPPLRPYFMLDVVCFTPKPGITMDPLETQTSARNAGYDCHTEIEVLMVAMLTDALTKWPLNACGSFCANDDIPILHQDQTGAPVYELGAGIATSAVSTPLCQQRLCFLNNAGGWRNQWLV
jgi:hypothetical protein